MNPDAPTIAYGPDAVPVGYHRLHPDPGMEFQLNRFLQWIGRSALDEIRAAATRIVSYPTWIDTFLALAATAREEGRVLPAAYYDRAAEFFMAPGDPRRPAARARFLRGMRGRYGLRPVQVAHRDVTLPAYDIHPAGASRGTVLFTGGFDE